MLAAILSTLHWEISEETNRDIPGFREGRGREMLPPNRRAKGGTEKFVPPKSDDKLKQGWRLSYRRLGQDRYRFLSTLANLRRARPDQTA